MPLLSYFAVVGSAMLAALFVANLYFPAQPRPEQRAVHNTTIRIHSARVTAPPVEIVPRAATLLAVGAAKTWTAMASAEKSSF